MVGIDRRCEEPLGQDVSNPIDDRLHFGENHAGRASRRRLPRWIDSWDDLARDSSNLPPVLSLDNFASVLGRSPKALRNMIQRGFVPKPVKLGGRLAWSRGVVLDFLAEIHGASQAATVQLNITATRYSYNKDLYLVTFTIPATKSEPRMRARRVAPAGLDKDAALAWAKKLEREIWLELMGEARKGDKPRPHRPEHIPTLASSPRSIKPQAPRNQTLAQFWDRFCSEYLSQQKPNTRKAYHSAWRLYLRPVLGDLPLGQIDKLAIGRLRVALGKLQPVGRNHVLAKIRSILNTAARWDVLEEEEIPRIRQEKEPKKADLIVYTEDEAARLIAAANNEGREYVAIIYLLLHGGLRVSELCALRWGDINLSLGIMTIQHNYSDGEESTPKGNEAAPVGMSTDLMTALASLPHGDPDDHVLTRVGLRGKHRGQVTHHTNETIRYRLNKIQAAAGLERSGPHKLRHSCLTLMAEKGCDPWRLQAHARHAHVSTTERYIHLAKQTKALEAAAVWSTPTEPVAQTGAQKSKRARASATPTN